MSKTNNVFKLKEMYKSKLFYSCLIVAGFCMATFAILYVGSAPSLSRLKEGDVSLRTIYAPYDFTYPTDIDKEKTKISKNKHMAKIN